MVEEWKRSWSKSPISSRLATPSGNTALTLDARQQHWLSLFASP